MDIFKFQLGDHVKDGVTGFSGCVTGRTEHYNGCIRYSVTPKKLTKDGDVMDDRFFDECELVKQKAGHVRPKKDTAERTGGPRARKSSGSRSSR